MSKYLIPGILNQFIELYPIIIWLDSTGKDTAYLSCSGYVATIEVYKYNGYIFEDFEVSVPFNGNSKYWSYSDDGITVDSVLQIAANGQILNDFICSSITTTTTTLAPLPNTTTTTTRAATTTTTTTAAPTTTTTTKAATTTTTTRVSTTTTTMGPTTTTTQSAGTILVNWTYTKYSGSGGFNIYRNGVNKATGGGSSTSGSFYCDSGDSIKAAVNIGCPGSSSGSVSLNQSGGNIGNGCGCPTPTSADATLVSDGTTITVDITVS